LRGLVGTSALDSLVRRIVQLATRLRIVARLVRFLAGKPAGDPIERPLYRVEYLSGG